jgi:hypothetical protein
MDKYLYLDTNIISELTKHLEWWDKFKSFLKEENFVIGISGAQLVELSDAFNLHSDLSNLLWFLPTKVLINWDEVIIRRINQGNLFGKIDVAFYPNLLSESPEQGAKRKFRIGLSGNNMKEARQIQLSDAEKMRDMIIECKHNFPPNKDGKYKPKQASKYARLITRQWLNNSNMGIKKLYKKYGNRIDYFRAIEIYAYFVFYKYYIAGHEAKKESDFGDLFHLFYLPFIQFAILDRGMVEILKQIQRNNDLLDGYNIDSFTYFRKIIGVSVNA